MKEELGFSNSEIIEAFGKDSKLNTIGNFRTTRSHLTQYVIMEMSTENEDRRLELITNLYKKDFGGTDEDFEEDIITAIQFMNRKYGFGFQVPEFEEPEPEISPEVYELEEVECMIGDPDIYESFKMQLGITDESDCIRRENLIKFIIESPLDEFSLEDRQSILDEMGVEGKINDIAAGSGLTPYIPRVEAEENNSIQATEKERTYVEMRNPPHIPPEGEYPTWLKPSWMIININEFFSNKFADLNERLRRELCEYCKKKMVKRDSNLYINLGELYRFFYDKHPELITSCYEGDSLYNIFRRHASENY